MPHSEIAGSKPILGSPTLIAEYHVLHRLLLPRHPPNALLALDLIQKKTGFFLTPCLLCATGLEIKSHTFPPSTLVHMEDILVSVLDLDKIALLVRTEVPPAGHPSLGRPAILMLISLYDVNRPIGRESVNRFPI